MKQSFFDPTQLKVVKSLNNEQNFYGSTRYTYTVLRAPDGVNYFSKRLRGEVEEDDAQWSRYLRSEAMWAQFASEAGRAFPELHFTGLAPLFTEIKNNRVEGLIYPFIDAPFVCGAKSGERIKNDALLRRYVDILLALDEYAGTWKPTATVDTSHENIPYDHLDLRWDAWIKKGELMGPGVLTDDILHEARNVMRDYEKSVTPRMQHGDFTPWHLFDSQNNQGENIWISFDGEHASPIKPRFYDVAYSYTRIFVNLREPRIASRLLALFVQKGVRLKYFNHNDFLEGFLPVVMSRCIGMFMDVRHDQLHETDEVKFREAHELFRRISQRNLSSLTGESL